jgi:hypothetical protein
VRSYTIRTVAQKVEGINSFLSALREYVDEDTGIKVFSMNRFARGIYRNYGEMDWAIKTLKKLGLLENLGSAGKAGGTWRVDLSDRMVAAEDLHGYSGNYSVPHDILVQQLTTERAKVGRLERELASRNARVDDLELELSSLRESTRNELLASLAIFLEEQTDPQS